MEKNKIIIGDSLQELKKMPGNFIDCCITSPPYYGLRDYGVRGQIGNEETPYEYITNLVKIFAEVKRCMKEDGTLWINIGDSYAGSNKGAAFYPETIRDAKQKTNVGSYRQKELRRGYCDQEIKKKDLIGIPWMLAFALRADGWYLRQDIIWEKPNPMPESVKDRCTKSHEYIFLLSKSPKYYFDNEAIKEPAIYKTGSRKDQKQGEFSGKRHAHEGFKHISDSFRAIRDTRNKRDVWKVPVSTYRGAHFATFPIDLIKPMILAGTRPGGVVLDPFIGSGTVAEAAIKLQREWIGIELNPEYVKLAKKRIEYVQTEMVFDKEAAGVNDERGIDQGG